MYLRQSQIADMVKMYIEDVKKNYDKYALVLGISLAIADMLKIPAKLAGALTLFGYFKYRQNKGFINEAG